MMTLRRGNEYVAIRRCESVVIDGLVDTWPPTQVRKIIKPEQRQMVKAEYLRMILKVESTVRCRTRMKLSGNFRIGDGEYITRTVLAWARDLKFYRVDFDEKKLYRIRKTAP